MNGLMIAFQAELILRLILASLCGFMIGYERKHRYKAAGVKTHMIVALASTLMMIVTKYGFNDVNDYDAARVAAQVVSGISFLGAGIIIKKNQNVEGLTTAALIWGMAGIGLALGAGLYMIGLAATALYLGMSYMVRWMESRQKLHHASYRLTLKTMDLLPQLIATTEQKSLISHSVEKNIEGRYVVSVMLRFQDARAKEEWEESILKDDYYLSFEPLS